MFQLRKMFRSFTYAFKGLIIIAKEEQSFRLQLVVSAVVLFLMFYFPLRNWEKVALILVITFVLVLELINSIFERFVDMLKPRMHFYVGAIKDVMAATVFLSSFAALVIGLIIFIPYFL
ncbi:MAG: diacylglycerol kinase [Candidatus Magasanikbacteria bacterium]|nr:diacylglycerol kinase [Candidatus Magasanikbacteria bacterium]